MCLSADYFSFRGDSAVCNGWLQRARHLLDDLQPTPEHAWLTYWQAHCALWLDHDNVSVARAVESVRTSIREGESIAVPLQASGMFPPMVIQMVKVGEETGALETMLNKVADFYDAEIDNTVASLTSILEPILIVGMGIVIGAMLISLYLPIFNLALSVK